MEKIRINDSDFTYRQFLNILFIHIIGVQRAGSGQKLNGAGHVKC